MDKTDATQMTKNVLNFSQNKIKIKDKIDPKNTWEKFALEGFSPTILVTVLQYFSVIVFHNFSHDEHI